jgi:uncharacterized LabA/DUF88 family protein
MERTDDKLNPPAEPVPGAVLVDFENMVYGLAHRHGAEHLAEVLCLPTLWASVRELVHPSVRRAYGDWRVRDLNQFQVELYRSGFELVQVLGRLTPGSRKNATDIRLAVDSVELALREPHLRRFVIVSGDRDMVEVVRCLHKHGREVVAIAPDWSASAELTEMVDRFVAYSAIQRRAGLSIPVPAPVKPALLEDLRSSLREILSEERAEPLRGTTLRSELVARYGRRFAEEEFGVPTFGRLLQLVPDVARVELQPTGDILVHATREREVGSATAGAPGAAAPLPLPRAVPGTASSPNGQGSAATTGANGASVLDAVDDGPSSAPPRALLPSQVQLVARARLANYRFEGDPIRRRALLRGIHAIGAAREDFSLADVRTALTGGVGPDSGHRPGDVNKCWTVLYQGRAFVPVTYDAITPMQFRRHRFAPEVVEADQVVRIYERCIVYKLAENSRTTPTAQEVRVLLGLQEEDLGWCTGLLDEVRRLLYAT